MKRIVKDRLYAIALAAVVILPFASVCCVPNELIHGIEQTESIIRWKDEVMEEGIDDITMETLEEEYATE